MKGWSRNESKCIGAKTEALVGVGIKGKSRNINRCNSRKSIRSKIMSRNRSQLVDAFHFFVKVEGKTICQSMAIARYCAKR